MNLNPDIPKDTNRGMALHALANASAVHTVTAADVTAGTVTVVLATEPNAVEVMVFSDAVTKKAWDGAVALDEDGVTLTIDNTGTTDFAAGDRIVIRAY